MRDIRFLIFLLWAAAAGIPAQAQLAALARVDADESRIEDRGDGLGLTLALSQPVPWRVFTLDKPRRLVVDMSEVIWPEAISEHAGVADNLRTGRYQPGWSRMVLDLDAPLVVASAEMKTAAEDGSARLRIELAPATQEEFAKASGAPPAALRHLPRRARSDAGATGSENAQDRRLHVVLDPGHGGIDPGANAGEETEADLMLIFARELRETLLRSGEFSVSLTRTGDVFVPLETRITIAREVGADVFLSLHADALPEEAGKASGATIYTLSDEASDLASQRLAERHDQSDLLAGVDLAGQSDEIAVALMDVARRETEPRTERLADALVRHVTSATGSMNSRPRRSAAFAVLKAPDFPSVLVELGFLSSEKDRRRLADAAWRKTFAEGIRDALNAWANEERARN